MPATTLIWCCKTIHLVVAGIADPGQRQYGLKLDQKTSITDGGYSAPAPLQKMVAAQRFPRLVLRRTNEYPRVSSEGVTRKVWRGNDTRESGVNGGGSRTNRA